MDTTNWSNEAWTASNTIGTVHFRWTDDDPDGGVRVPVKPKPKSGAPAVALTVPRELACV